MIILHFLSVVQGALTSEARPTDATRDVLHNTLQTLRLIEQSLSARHQLSLVFNQKCGKNVKVSPDGRFARRVNPDWHFNHGVVLSSRCLADDEIFEVVIEKVTTRWTGSVEAG